MTAGASAHQRSERALLEATEYERLAVAARELAGRYELASRTEERVGGRLAALEVLGWKVLADRRWSGSRRANVDFLLVGPGGVLVVDVKAWRSLQVVGGSLYCEEECRDGDASKLLGLAQRVEDAVATVGLTPQVVRPLLVLAGRQVHEHARTVDLVGELDVATWATRLGRRLDPAQVEMLAELLAREFPPYDAPPGPPEAQLALVPDPAPAAPPPPVAARRRLVLTRRSPERPPEVQGELFDVDELTQSIVAAALALPIEDWMTFLHPEQLSLVSASAAGPARIRGEAGTGKTVVGLHRAVYLAGRLPDPVLFVTYVRTLPLVLGNLARRLAPEVADRIDFTGLHALAMRLLLEAGVEVCLDLDKADAAFAAAWAAHGRDSVLTALDPRWSYWKEELDHVLKGRGLTDYDDYAELSRVGRRIPMRPEHRQAMWEVYAAYERRLRIAELVDFNDVLMLARDLVRSGGSRLAASYGAVLVDEVQDLNLVGLQLLHEIGGDGPDGLLLIGDGRQAVYPGGFTLAEAGISVTGRATVLRTNYRNTAEILELARRVVADDAVEDIGDAGAEVEVVGSADGPDVRRRGLPPLVVRAADPVSLDLALVKQLTDTVEALGVPWGDLAVLVQRRADVDHYGRVLRRAKVPVIDLLDYDGTSVDSVKLGTFKRAKGLEFRYVLMPGLKSGLQPARDESQEAFVERAERTRREMHVGMTRARDGLWLGYAGA